MSVKNTLFFVFQINHYQNKINMSNLLSSLVWTERACFISGDLTRDIFVSKCCPWAKTPNGGHGHIPPWSWSFYQKW